ncbi:MAG: four helix bundle protein [Kiritimatiellales bacterium]|nr:four helix bundle protein [Kiritimatiellales bacterium]
MKSFTDLEAWKEAMNFVEEVYKITADFPKSEQYGITNQLRRASTSVVANIAEGFGRYSYAEKAQRYVIARGECSEVKAFLLVATRVKLISKEEIHHLLELNDKVGRLLSGLIQSSRNRS